MTNQDIKLIANRNKEFKLEGIAIGFGFALLFLIGMAYILS